MFYAKAQLLHAKHLWFDLLGDFYSCIVVLYTHTVSICANTKSPAKIKLLSCFPAMFISILSPFSFWNFKEIKDIMKNTTKAVYGMRPNFNQELGKLIRNIYTDRRVQIWKRRGISLRTSTINEQIWRRKEETNNESK